MMNSMPEKNRFVRGIRSYVGLRQIGVPYERAAREAGKPKYTLKRLLRLAADGIFNFKQYRLDDYPLLVTSTNSLLETIQQFDQGKIDLTNLINSFLEKMLGKGHGTSLAILKRVIKFNAFKESN